MSADNTILIIKAIDKVVKAYKRADAALTGPIDNIFRGEDANDNSIFGYNRDGRVTVTGGNPVGDHQGHIIPQNKLFIICQNIWQAFKNSASEANHQKLAESLKILDYWKKSFNGDLINPICRDRNPANGLIDANDHMIFSFLNSAIVWNPANICLAPVDNIRPRGIPGQDTDYQVMNYLESIGAKDKVTLLKEADTLIDTVRTSFDNNDKGMLWMSSIGNFNTKWLQLLNKFNRTDPLTGFYAFPWKADAAGQLSPDKARRN